jgi:hypothetical protein
MFDKIDDFVSDLKSEIANLERENYRLKRKLEELQKEKDNKEWQPEIEQNYFYIDSCGDVENCGYSMSYIDKWRLKQGNCFKTHEQAKKHLENLKTKAELKALADELNGKEMIDWNNEEQEKFCIVYVPSRNTLENHIGCFYKIQGAVYCLDEDFSEKAIEHIGKQRLIDMIRSGV